MTQDLRYACRTLWKNPGFSVTSVLLLAIGMGGTTILFSIVNAVFFRELPVREPGRLARIVTAQHNRPDVSAFPYRIFEHWTSRTQSFASTFAQTELDISYADDRGSRSVHGQIVSRNYFAALEMEPLLGRLLREKDAWAAGDELPVVLSYRFWKDRFQQNPEVLGRVVHLAAHPFTIVGITKPEFSGTSVESGPDLQLPLIAGRFLTADGSEKKDARRCCIWEIGGRLRPGVSLSQAEAETSISLRAAFGSAFAENKSLLNDREWILRQQFRVQPLSHGVSWLRQRFSTGLVTLLGAAFLLLLLACANIAGLLLARAAANEQQNAIRLAVGASRRHLLQQSLTEGALLALAGGTAALLVTAVCLPHVDAFLPPMRDLMTRRLPVALHLSLDFRIFAFAFFLCCGVTLLTAASPAWFAAHASLLAPLQAMNASRRHARLRSVLVCAQMAICTVVIANASLLFLTLRKLETTNPGFRRDHVVTFTVDTALEKYNVSKTYALALALWRAARDVPGVAGASVAVKPLLRGAGMRMSVAPLAGKRSAIEELNADANAVSPGYFQTLGVRVLAGRTFDDHDLQPRQPIPVIVNHTLASTFFPNRSALGQHLDWPSSGALKPRYEIIGIVADTKYRSLREASFPALFSPLQTSDDVSQSSFEVVVRTFAAPKSIVLAMNALLGRLDSRLVFREVHTMQEDLDTSLWAEHTLTQLGLLFAGVSTLLAAIGLYGLLSYVLIAGRREIAIRIAMGARPVDIMQTAVLRTFTLVGLGIAIGTAGSITAATLLRRILYDIAAWDFRALLASATVVVVCSALASWRPIALSGRLNLMAVLRGSD